jgi:hypothetical protein
LAQQGAVYSTVKSTVAFLRMTRLQRGGRRMADGGCAAFRRSLSFFSWLWSVYRAEPQEVVVHTPPVLYRPKYPGFTVVWVL